MRAPPTAAELEKASLVPADQDGRGDAKGHDQDRRQDAEPKEGHDRKHEGRGEDDRAAHDPAHASEYNVRGADPVQSVAPVTGVP